VTPPPGTCTEVRQTSQEKQVALRVETTVKTSALYLVLISPNDRFLGSEDKGRN